MLGSLQLVVGCAGSGKTQYLQYLYKKHEPLDQSMLRFSVRTEDDLSAKNSLSQNLLANRIRSKSYQSSSYIFIDDLHS